MTEFLVKKFVKDYQNTEDAQVRTHYGILSSCVGIFCNVLLFGTKLVIGLLMNSLAIMADALNNLSDAASSIISFVGVKMASKPADKEHPFGHGRIEYIAALIVSFLVIEVGITCFRSSFGKLFHPEPIAFEWVPFLILLLSVGVKLWMSLFNRKLGKRIDSKVMLAAAADSAGDVIVTSATLASILIGYFTSVNVDAIAGLAVSLLVIWSGINIARDTLEPLIGQRPDPELYHQIQEMVESYDGIVGTHDLIIHNYGPNRSMASIHAEVPRETDIEVSHEIIDRIERDVARKLNIFLVIHMDPVEVNDQKVVEKKMAVNELVKKIEPKASIHDFRIVNGEQQINLIFDLVVPRSYGKEKENELLLQVIEAVRKMDSKYQCVITLETSYIEEEE